MRLFVALPIPDAVARGLMLLQGGVPGARWQAREQLHLTLRFIGEVDGADARALDDALAGIDAPAFELQLHGVGQFGNKQPHALWAAARKNELLDHLARKVDSAIRRVGQPQDAHKFMPHVTLARLRHPELERMRDWLTAHALYTSETFTVDGFCLYSSKLTSDGSIYRVERAYPLRGFDGETDN
jgi:RNA 2',3'-cyclic 3'-phosphodiesterase